MDKINVDKLYEIYSRNHQGLFSKMRFQRILKSEKTKICINTLRNIFNEYHYFVGNCSYNDNDLYVGFFNLLNRFSFNELYKLMYYYREDDKVFEKKIFSIVGMNQPCEMYHTDMCFPLNLICHDFLDYNKLLTLYGETIYNAMLETDIYTERMAFLIKMDNINSYKEFLEYRLSNPSGDELVSTYNIVFGNIIMKYSVDELLNDSERVKKEIMTGITAYLPYPVSGETNSVSENREIFDKMMDHFDSKTLSIFFNIYRLLKPIADLVDSNRFQEDELIALKNMYILFSKIDQFMKSMNYEGLLELIEETVKNDESGLEFYEIINDYILTYEYLIRKDIIENVNTFENVPTEQLSFTDSKGRTLLVECGYIATCEQLASPLIHFIKDESMDSEDLACNYIINTINVVGNYALVNHTRSSEDIKQLIVDLYSLYKEYDRYINPNRDVKAELNEKFKKILTPEEIELSNNEFKLYLEHDLNYAEVTQINKVPTDLHDFIRKETDDFKKPLVSKYQYDKDMNRKLDIITSPVSEKVLSTQILRQNSYKDFVGTIGINNPYLIGVTFDKRGLTEDSIMLSSTDNLETNNMPIVYFDDRRTIRRSSATLDMLKTTTGFSDMTRRINNEIVLITSSVSPKCLLIFFNTPITDEIIGGIRKAQRLAAKSNLKLVLVNYQMICNELQSRERKDEQVYVQEETSEKSRAY